MQADVSVAKMEVVKLFLDTVHAGPYLLGLKMGAAPVQVR